MVNEAYTNLVELFAEAAKKDLETETSALERSGLEMLLDGGPYEQDNDPTIYDLLRFARRVAESHEHATSLRAAIESITRRPVTIKVCADTLKIGETATIDDLREYANNLARGAEDKFDVIAHGIVARDVSRTECDDDDVREWILDLECGDGWTSYL